MKILNWKLGEEIHSSLSKIVPVQFGQGNALAG